MENAEQTLAMEVDLSHLTKDERVAMGERVSEMVESQGFRDFCQVIKLHSEGILAQVKLTRPKTNASEYADVIGHLRGLDELGPIARGIVEDGKLAAAEKAREEEGQ